MMGRRWSHLDLTGHAAPNRILEDFVDLGHLYSFVVLIISGLYFSFRQ